MDSRLNGYYNDWLWKSNRIGWEVCPMVGKAPWIVGVETQDFVFEYYLGQEGIWNGLEPGAEEDVIITFRLMPQDPNDDGYTEGLEYPNLLWTHDLQQYIQTPQMIKSVSHTGFLHDLSQVDHAQMNFVKWTNLEYIQEFGENNFFLDKNGVNALVKCNSNLQYGYVLSCPRFIRTSLKEVPKGIFDGDFSANQKILEDIGAEGISFENAFAQTKIEQVDLKEFDTALTKWNSGNHCLLNCFVNCTNLKHIPELWTLEQYQGNWDWSYPQYDGCFSGCTAADNYEEAVKAHWT